MFKLIKEFVMRTITLAIGLFKTEEVKETAVVAVEVPEAAMAPLLRTPTTEELLKAEIESLKESLESERSLRTAVETNLEEQKAEDKAIKTILQIELSATEDLNDHYASQILLLGKALATYKLHVKRNVSRQVQKTFSPVFIGFDAETEIKPVKVGLVATKY